MTHYQRQAVLEEDRHLKYYSDQANQEQLRETKHQLIVNMSLREIAGAISATVISIINELLDPKVKKDLAGLIQIFFKQDRMIYLGIVVLLISLGLYFTDISREIEQLGRTV